MEEEMKRIITLLMSLLIVLTMSFSNINVRAAENEYTILYQKFNRETLAKGLEYENRKMITTVGGLNVHILKVDTTNPDLTFKVLDSTTSVGKRESLTDLLKNSGALAAVNADFFDMGSTYGSSVGAFTRNNSVVNVGNGFNVANKQFYSFGVNANALGTNTDMFIKALTSYVSFKNNGVVNMTIAAHNKMTGFDFPIIMDADYIKNTIEIDTRLKTVVKIVVNDGFITYISKPGENITLPNKENGFAVLLTEKAYLKVKDKYAVGQTASMSVSTSFDLSRLETLVGGGGLILENGSIAIGKGEVIGGRQPRTAIAYNQDKTKAFLVVVDGRGESVGVTHEEFAVVLREIGAYTAMYFDGGGSSTMAIEPFYANAPKVYNDISGTQQRTIANALAVVNNAIVGAPTSAKIYISDTKIFNGFPVNVSAGLCDVNQNKVKTSSAPYWSVSGVRGEVKDGKLYVYEKGIGKLNVTLNGITTSVDIIGVGDPIGLLVNDGFNTSVGNKTKLNISLISAEGYTKDIIASAKLTCSDTTLGSISDGYFTAKKEGTLVITVTYKDFKSYIMIGIGNMITKVEPFEATSIFEYTLEKTAGVLYLGDKTITTDVKYEGNSSLKLDYSFSNIASINDKVSFKFNRFKAASRISYISIWAKADNLNNELFLKITDALGQQFSISMGKLSGSEWKFFKADIPATAMYPLMIEEMYVAGNGNNNGALSTLYFDHLCMVGPKGVLNANSINQVDSKMTNLATAPKGLIDIALFGNLVEGGVEQQKDLVSKMNQADIKIYGNKTNFIDSTDLNTYVWSDTSKYYQRNDVVLLTLSLKTGALYKGNTMQLVMLELLPALTGKNVIVYCDKNPLETESAIEKEILEYLFSKLADAKNAFIVYKSESTTSIKMINGIRYVGIDSYMAGEVANQNKALFIRLYENDFAYEIR
jgi:exopolysaccharide biosynthesis protein